jgi:CubicO group peptidase (beta-lactamase class C family)
MACNPAQKVVSPESVGLNGDSLKLAETLMQKYVDEGKLAGISTMVIKNGQMVERANFGYADLETKKPVEDNTIFRIFSMTKPVTAVALMMLFEEGKFQLDDKISKFIPEFAGTMVYKSVDKSFTLEKPVNEITVRHLLTHTSGISYGWEPKSYVDSLYRVAKVGGWDATIGEKVKALAGLPLNFQPGTEWKYGLSIDVAGYLVEVLSGMPLDIYMKTRIFDPLKMEDTGFFVLEEKLGRLAQITV